MDLLVVTRTLTLLVWLALAWILLELVVFRRPSWSVGSRGAWGVIALRHCSYALSALVAETAWVLHRVAGDSAVYQTARLLYNPGYYMNAVVDALAPLLIAGVLLGPGRLRRACFGAVWIVAATAAVGSFSVQRWELLMSVTQALAFVTVAGYLVFWAILLLGRLSRADAYLLGIMAIATVFHLLLPIQAHFFREVGQVDAVRIWHLNQFLQLVMAATGLAIVLAFRNVLVHGRSPRPVHIRV